MIALLFALALPAFAQTELSSWEASPGMLRQSGLVIFFGTQGPLSYASLTPAGLPKGAVPIGEVKGESCQHGLSIPRGLGLRSTRLSAARGAGGFERALVDIRSRNRELRGVYDAKIDDHVVSILGIYRRLCTEITARGFK